MRVVMPQARERAPASGDRNPGCGEDVRGITSFMKSHSETVFAHQFRGNQFSHSRWTQILIDATAMFEALPTTREPGLRCHEVARAVARTLTLKTDLLDNTEPKIEFVIVDGTYGPGGEHSWIDVLINNVQRCVLDPYCIGRMPPVALVDITSLTLAAHRDLYRPGEYRLDIDDLLVARLVAFLEPKFVVVF